MMRRDELTLNLRTRNPEASEARPFLRPWFRLADIWNAPLHSLPMRDELVYQYLPLAAEMRVLEVGPGNGFTAFRLARHVQELTLVDIAASNITRLREALQPIRNVRFVCEDVCHPDLVRVVGSQFDAIFGLEVFYLVPDPGRCLVNLARLLRPGGHLLLQFPNYPPPITPLKTFFRQRKELDQLLETAGFQSWTVNALRLRPAARFVYAVCQDLQQLLQTGGQARGQRAITYECSWLFQSQSRLTHYRPLFHMTWALLFAALRVSGDCFERIPLGSDILNCNLLLLAER